ncbi:hypothetical protein ASPACDRAFT_53556 [Aspergillus aculeatus ATCC 16872]|uniref:Major facilitator superfamily (MFS) profile domain-containing protein n=1 Tax=Aspergillus aculeatus (strain ATCC 16872 / CBS 172.66 / WB 5094) TaxID=690307 RepID=A0A1L9WPG9_ASPA1|nr:uncharacterized protein ASPACDRAFT_53556 [Aspergillus aculeatus ATCC 16872]OJJ98031.1 hypothetical protein ASPACDRAFT_53556 [Aspergillus aculeatus ATCC 16872]
MQRHEFDLPSELPAEDINELYHSHGSTSTTQVDVEADKDEHADGRQHPLEAAQEGSSNTSDSLAQGPKGAPDGGVEAWLTVLGGFCAMFVSFGWVNCMGIFIDYYKTHQLRDESTSTVTWVTSLMTFMMFFGGPFVGILFDNFGPRYIVLAGTFFHVFGLMMISISSEYYQFLLAQGLCSPIGTSALFHCSINSISTWFGRRRALALGIATSGASLGGVILPIMLTRLFDQLDFGWAVRICAFLILFCLVIANCTLKSRLQHRRKPFHFLDFVRPLREVPFLLTTAGTFCFFWGMFLPFSFIPSQAQKNGITPGRIIPPYLADLFGRFNLMILMTFLSVILVLGLWLPTHGNVPSICFSALYGFSSGTAVSLAPALVAQISEIREIGVRSGTYFFLVSFAALTGTPIAGALLPDPLHGSYLKLNVFCAVVMCSGVGFYCLAKLWISEGRVVRKV